MAGRFYAFAYYQSMRDLRLETRPMESQIHKVRDALMSGGLFPILGECGYQYGGSILNLPSDVAAALRKGKRLIRTSERLTQSDLLLMATRPPLDDQREDAALEGKRRLLPSGHAIEKTVFRSLRKLLPKCDRETIRLSESIPLDGNDWLREVHFYQSKGGSIRYCLVKGRREAPRVENLTVGYVISIPSRRAGVPRLVAAFGPGGTETLLLGYLLREEPRLNKVFREMLLGNEARIVLCTFRLPAKVPFPFLKFELDEMDAQIRIDRLLVSHS